jgi:hypothetical protein
MDGNRSTPQWPAVAPFLELGDPAADTALTALRSDDGADDDARLRAAAARGEPAAEALLHLVDQVPAWVDPERLALGAEVFLADVRVGLGRILLGTLPLSYTSPSGARVLLATGDLLRSARRRLYETATFVLALMEAGGSLPGSRGHRACVNVRLRHARVRRSLLGRGWIGSLPINQADSAFIGAAFSQITLDGLRRLGSVDHDEADALQHLWHYADWLLGVPEALSADTDAEGAALLQHLRRALSHPTDDSRALTDALHRSFAWSPPFTGMPPALLQAMTRVMVGDATADALELPQRALLRHGLEALRRRERARRRLRSSRRARAEAGLRYFRETVESGLRQHGGAAVVRTHA